MSLFDNDTAMEIKKNLDSIEGEVKIVFFKENLNCLTCPDAEQFLKEIAQLSDKVKLEIYNKLIDEEKAKQYNPEMVPAIFIETQKSGKRVIFYGIPSGYEFVSFLEALRNSSSDKLDLQEETLEKLKKISKPINIKVFVTPSCPYCPSAVVLAHKLAIANTNIIAQMIEAQEFPQLSLKYEVEGVPKTVINDTVHLVGAQDESVLLGAISDLNNNGKMTN
jgi:glutaredoxin-like protein